MEGKSIKKTTKITGIFLAIVLVLMVSASMLIQVKSVQQVLVSIITKNITSEIGADVSVGKVNIRFFRSLVLDDVFLSDQNKDTIFYSEQIIAKVDSLQFFKKRVHFKSVNFKNIDVNLARIDSNSYNFSFLFNKVKKDTLAVKSEWKLFCNRFEIEHGSFDFLNPNGTQNIDGLTHLSDINIIVDSTKFVSLDDLSLKLEELSFKTNSGIELRNFTTKIILLDSILTVSELAGSTLNSEIKLNKSDVDFKRYFLSKNLSDIKYSIDINKLKFGLKDISFLLDSSYDNGITTSLSGKLQGDFSDIRGKDINFSVEKFTSLSGDFYLNGIQDINTLYIFCNLNESFANLKEIRNLDLPPAIEKAISDLPDIFNNVGTFRYKGNFTGFLDDFVAYGTAYSNLGTISSDISFRPGKNDELNIQGRISTESLDVGTIFNNEKLDKLSLNGEVKGTLNNNAEYDLVFVGMVNAVDFNNYSFKKIDLNGTIKNKQFNGMFSIADPNLKMVYSGNLDLSPELPVFEFVAEIDRANLDKLHLVRDKRAILRMKVNANFVGNNIDNVAGYLALSDVKYHNTVGRFDLNSIVLNNTYRNDTSFFTLQSDIVDGELTGHYNLMNIGSSLITYYQNYMPSSYYTYLSDVSTFNDFKFHFRIKDIYPVIKVFVPGLYVEPDFEFMGSYNPLKEDFSFETFIPLISYNKRDFDNIKIAITADSSSIHTRLKADQIGIGNNISLYNFSVNSEANNDTLGVNLYWNNYEESTYSGKLKTITSFQKTNTDYPNIVTKIESSNIYFGDSLWVMDETIVAIDSSAIKIDKLNFHHNDQRFWVDGKIANNNTDQISARIENVDFELFEPFIGKSFFSGKINGKASLTDLYEKMMLNLDLSVNDFSFSGGYLGDFTINSRWDNKKESLASRINLVKDEIMVVDAFGDIDPLNKQLDMQLKFDNSPISILQIVMPSTFNNQNGLVDGDIHLHGNLLHIMHDGVLNPVGDVGMGLTYLNTMYSLHEPLWFSNDSIIFRNLQFFDKDGNSGILNGSIKHHTFFDMSYNLNVQTGKLLAMNTTLAQNDAFYGTAYVSGNIDITGEGDNILISGDAKTERGTSVYIPFDSEENAEKYDFIEFVNQQVKKVETPEYSVVTSGVEMDFDLDVTPDAKVQIIFNSQVGDVIKGAGSGDLQVKVDRNYNINMYGNYIINEGDYLFTLQNVLNKRFTIEPGGSIEWIGDPYNALIDIKAVYKVKTSLYDLFVGSYPDIDLSRRIPVDCGIHLRESLLNPKIDFSVELPTVEERIRDEVNQLVVTQEDINKQMISLLMLGRFYTPEFFAGKLPTETGAELVGATATEIFSNQLSNWLSQITDVLDVGVNWRPGNDITKDQVEVALSTQILNDRLTIDGNFANNANQNANSNGQFVSDFDVNFKLTDNGKLQFKAYNHANDNIIYDTAPYTQGIGFSYREEFNTFKQLFNRFKEAILPDKKKRNTEVVPKEDENPN